MPIGEMRELDRMQLASFRAPIPSTKTVQGVKQSIQLAHLEGF